MTWLFEPRIFNLAIIVMFLASMVRWACSGNWAQACYWLGAAILNISILIITKP